MKFTPVTYIYALAEPTTGEVRYIGKSNTPIVRLERGHMYQTARNNHKMNWISSLRKNGLKPVLKILEVCPVEQWEARERHYIETYRKTTPHLLNIASGGVSSDMPDHLKDSSYKKYLGIPSDVLFRLYVVENLNREEVAARLNVKPRSVKRYLEKYRIKKPKEKWLENEKKKQALTLTKIFEDSIIKMRKAGKVNSEIACALSIPVTTVSNVCVKHGLTKTQSLSFKRILDESDNRVYSLKAICDKYGIKPHTLREQVRHNRLKLKIKLL